MRGVMVALALMAAPSVAAAQDVNARQPVSIGKNRVPPIGPTPPILVVEPVAMMIATFDDDHDGKVSRDELKKGVARSFDAIDTAHSGKMGYIVFGDWAKQWLGDVNALPSPYEVDTNGDDQITIDELQASFVRTFARLDKDKDGVLTRAELLTIRAEVRTFGDGKRGKRNGAP
jgi:Ca2+-binding EF-hand superfamily protein